MENNDLNLLTLSDFVLKIKNENKSNEEKGRLIFDYLEFLKLPLTVEMLIPSNDQLKPVIENMEQNNIPAKWGEYGFILFVGFVPICNVFGSIGEEEEASVFIEFKTIEELANKAKGVILTKPFQEILKDWV